MPLTICFYEDSKFDQFYPLTFLRPVFFLRSGILPFFAKYKKHFPDAVISFSVRDQISALVSHQESDVPTNIIRKGRDDVLFLNGRIRDYGDLANFVPGCRLNTIFKNNDETIGVLFKADAIKSISDLSTPDVFKEVLPAQKANRAVYDTTATLYNYLWEIVDDIPTQIAADFKQLESTFGAPHNPKLHEGSHLISENNIYLGNDVELFPTSIVDASNGPIFIGANCQIQPQAIINGPCFIGANSVVFQGKISGSSIGPTSRVGGEIEACVFQSYVNKYHAGFIGHSYVGSWVNFGAMTTNSDLKNNYSNVKVNVNGVPIDTGSIKVGSLIGDHSKFGIGMLLNTGINIGVGCNLFGGSLLTDKEIKSFLWGQSNSFANYDIDKAIGTIKAVCERRQTQLSSSEEEVLRLIHNNEISKAGCLDI